jgi:exoribonuclease R
MGNSRRHARHDLRAIARRAMIERGFLPEFSPEVRAAVETMTAPGHAASARDLRDLLWCSIDNDDSLDLDQRTVADELEDGAVKMLVAVADVDETVRKNSAVDAHAARNTT